MPSTSKDAKKRDLQPERDDEDSTDDEDDFLDEEEEEKDPNSFFLDLVAIKELSETRTIKVPINAIINDDEPFLKILNETLVPFWNRLKFHTSLIANFYVHLVIVDHRKSRTDVTKMNLTMPLFNQKFFKDIMKKITNMGTRKEKETENLELEAVFEELPVAIFSEFKGEKFNRTSFTKVLEELGLQMQVETQNHLKLNFPKQLSKYIKFLNKDNNKTREELKELFKTEKKKFMIPYNKKDKRGFQVNNKDLMTLMVKYHDIQMTFENHVDECIQEIKNSAEPVVNKRFEKIYNEIKQRSEDLKPQSIKFKKNSNKKTRNRQKRKKQKELKKCRNVPIRKNDTHIKLLIEVIF